MRYVMQGGDKPPGWREGDEPGNEHEPEKHDAPVKEPDENENESQDQPSS